MVTTEINFKAKPKLLNVICDSNVWYGVAAGRETIADDVKYIATSLSIMEIASSSNMVDLEGYQKLIQVVYENTGPIIPVDPLDFVIMNHDSNYAPSNKPIINVLKEFSVILAIVDPNEVIIDEELKAKIQENCKIARKATVSFAEFGNQHINSIRKAINKGDGRKKHLQIDTTELIREMFKAIINDHLKDSEYEMDFTNFDWSQVELFICVIDNYFKKLETTKDMKVHANDAVDVLNMLYVTPGDKYHTFERSWRAYIENDERIAHYLYR